MMPGMFGGGGPEPLPEHKAQEQFWSGLKSFLAFTAVSVSVSALIRYIEARAHDAIQ
jgi:hypothetical protein